MSWFNRAPKLVTVSFGGDFQVEMLASDVAAANELVRTDPHPESHPLIKEVLRANIVDILSGGADGLTEARMAKLKTFLLNWNALGGR